VKLTTNRHLVPRSRMRGAIPPLPNKPSWRDAQLQHRNNFSFISTLTEAHHSKEVSLAAIKTPTLGPIYVETAYEKRELEG
jgi:hypothetical protein